MREAAFPSRAGLPSFGLPRSSLPRSSLPRAGVCGAARFHEIWRFATVGIVTFGINFAAFSLLFGLMHAHYRVAVSLAFAVTVVCHFFLNKTFTFDARAHKVRSSAPRYGALLALNYGIAMAASWLTVEVAGASPYLAVVASTAGTSLSSFLSMKYFVFRPLAAEPLAGR